MDIQIEIAIAAVLGLVGFRQLDLGMRPRRVGSEPHCRKCEYDLRGLPETVTNCSECGADLSLKNAKVRGVAIRRAAPIWKGLILLLIACVPTVHMVQRITANGWTQVEPVWMLRWALGSGDAQTRKAADMELWRRLSGDELSQTDLVRIAKWGANSTLSASELPKIVADAAAVARGAGRLSDEDFAKLWKTGFSPTVRMKEKVRQGNTLVFDISVDNELNGHGTSSSIRFACVDVAIDGRSIADFSERGARTISSSAKGTYRGQVVSKGPSYFGWLFSSRIPPEELKSERLGPHTLRFKVQYTLSLGSKSPSSEYSGEVTVERRFELVAPDQPTIRLLTGPVHAQRALNGPMVTWRNDRYFLEVAQPPLSMPPVPMAFGVFIKDAEHTFQIGRWSRHLTEFPDITTLTVRETPAELVSEEFEVILVPDPELAEKGELVNEIWGETISFKSPKAATK